MNFCMPEMDGPETAKKILKELASCTPPLPKPLICFMTSYAGDECVKRAKEAGSNFFLCKPVFKTRLEQLLITANLLPCLED